VAAISTVIATALGTFIALALIRYRFFGFSATNLLVLIPLTTPEIVLGASLLTLFLQFGVQTGFTTIIIAHVMFNISYVVVTVKARLRGFDWTLEEAAMDLGANEFQTFRKVTLPLIFPGILAAALLAFALSLDDFIITLFNSGQEVTFPLFVWGSARVAVPPQINVMGTMIMGSTVVLMVLSLLLQRRRA
jgi:spermidine/putrescine transport system permease protein